MRNKKIKFFISACIGCMLFWGLALTVFAAGALSIAVSSGTVKTGETVTVTVYAENANGEEATADMSITYDSSKLEYVSSSSSGASGGGGTVKVSGSDVDIKFKALTAGDAYVKAEGVAVTAAGTHITVSGTGNTDDAGTSGTKSGDNSLSSLKLSHGTLSPSFKGSVTEYTAEVGSDISEITVTPVTSNSKATVESITGNKDLKSGTNVITVLVKAENGTTASYKITVTKKDTPQTSSGNEAPSDTPEEGTAGDGGTDAADMPTGSDTVAIDGVNYKISGEFPAEAIPEGFSTADFEYKGTPYKGIMFNKGYLGMYYLVDEAGKGEFFIYDSNRDSFYPYVRLNCGEHYIILMTVPNGVIPPDNYEQAVLTIGETSSIPAYQYTGGEDKEIVKIDVEGQETEVGGQSDFYIFYGMDETGITCWYQYDTLQGTYQRYNEEALSSADTSEDYETLAASYKELDERQKSTRVKDRRIIAVMIFVSVVLLIIIINLLLKVRDLKADEDEAYEEERPKRRTEPVHVRKPAKPVKKARPARKTYRKIQEVQEDTDFYEGDDEDVIDEFEEEPSVLGRSRRPKKKEKTVKTRKSESADQTPARPAVPIQDDDDDLEFLDLDDF